MKARRVAGSSANMMDGTIQEEINPEAQAPGELGGVSILKMLNECAGLSSWQHIYLQPTLRQHGEPPPPHKDPGSAPSANFLWSRDGKGMHWGVDPDNTPIGQMGRLRPGFSWDLSKVK